MRLIPVSPNAVRLGRIDDEGTFVFGPYEKRNPENFELKIAGDRLYSFLE